MRCCATSVFRSSSKCISVWNRQGIAVRTLPRLHEEVPSSLSNAQWCDGFIASRAYRASASLLISLRSSESSTSSWDVGHPAVDENHTERGQTKAEHRVDETPASSLQRETDTRQMFHAKAKETEERLSHEGKLEDSCSAKKSHDSSATQAEVISGMIEEAEGKSVWALGMKVTVKCPGETTNGLYSLLQYDLLPGEGSQTHTHSREDETWYMLEGEMEWTLRDKTFQAKKGCFIHLPSGIPHSFHNNSNNPARMLVSCLPAGLENYFLDIGVPVDPNPDAKRPTVSEDDARIATGAGRKYGVTFSSPGT